MLYAWTVISAACAAIPALLTVANLGKHTPPPSAGDVRFPRLSALIPGRNELGGIPARVESVLASHGVLVGVLVLVPVTLLLLLGQVLAAVLLWLAWQHTFFVIPFLGPPLRVGMSPVWWASAALVLSYLPRLINTVRYRQSWLGALLHPLGVVLLLVLQWVALARKLAGRSAK